MPFGINWKIVGLVCGACAAPFTGGTSLVAACVACGGAGLVAGHFLDEKEKKDKIDKQNVDLKGKTVETIITENKQAQQESDEWKNKCDELNGKIKKQGEEIKKFQNKLRDPNLTPEERKKINGQLQILIDQQENDIKERDSILEKIKKIGERIKNNNQVISETTSNPKNKHWIWDLLTLENIFIVGACYVAYKLLKDDK